MCLCVSRSEETPRKDLSVKDELVELVGAGLASVSSNKKRLMINELLLKLEATNPTASPAYSPLLNGPWQFIYTGGISPGMLGTLPSHPYSHTYFMVQ